MEESKTVVHLVRWFGHALSPAERREAYNEIRNALLLEGQVLPLHPSFRPPKCGDTVVFVDATGIAHGAIVATERDVPSGELDDFVRDLTVFNINSEGAFFYRDVPYGAWMADPISGVYWRPKVSDLYT